MSHLSMPWEAALTILLFGLMFPGLAIASHKKARVLLLALRPRDLPGFHVNQAATLGLFGVIAMLPLATGAASRDSFGLAAPAWGDVMPGLVLVAGLVLLSAFARQMVIARAGFRRWLTHLVPDEVMAITPKDRRSLGSWSLLSLGAGVGEEAMFRAALPWALGFLMSPSLAVLFAAIAFALGHLYQGRRNALLILVFGIGFGALMLTTGSLPLVMILHAVYDFEVGRIYLALHRSNGSAEGDGLSEPT